MRLKLVVNELRFFFLQRKICASHILLNVFQKYSYYIFCLTLEIGFQKKQYRAL